MIVDNGLNLLVLIMIASGCLMIMFATVYVDHIDRWIVNGVMVSSILMVLSIC